MAKSTHRKLLAGTASLALTSASSAHAKPPASPASMPPCSMSDNDAPPLGLNVLEKFNSWAVNVRSSTLSQA